VTTKEKNMDNLPKIIHTIKDELAIIVTRFTVRNQKI